MSHLSRMAFCGLRTLKPLAVRRNQFGDNNLFAWQERPDWYPLKKINIFTGPNGAGKSTVLDLISVLAQPGRLATLARENRHSESAAAFMLDFDNQVRLRVQVDPIANDAYPSDSNIAQQINGQYLVARIVTLDERGREDRKLGGLNRNISKIDIAADTERYLARDFRQTACQVHNWDGIARLAADDVVSILNDARTLLPGLISAPGVADTEGLGALNFAHRQKTPFHVLEQDDSRVGVWLAHDQAQSNNVLIATLPSGWLQLVSILSWMGNLPDGSVVVLDEPETHLHPRLQRYLAEKMNQMVSKKSLQLFIATHAPTLQNPVIWTQNQDNVAIFEADGAGLHAEPNVWRLLDALGVRNSDLAQSNGVIWVEGPSDRIYIKHWLSLWCREQGDALREPVENADYSFAFYGGSILSHYSADDADGQFIDLLRVNRNAALFMDRDHDFERLADGTFQCLNPNSAKQRVALEFERVVGNCGKYWITDKYTIESYLPAAFITAKFEVNGERLLPLSGSKADIGTAYVKAHKSYDTALGWPDLVWPKISELHALIMRWNA